MNHFEYMYFSTILYIVTASVLSFKSYRNLQSVACERSASAIYNLYIIFANVFESLMSECVMLMCFNASSNVYIPGLTFLKKKNRTHTKKSFRCILKCTQVIYVTHSEYFPSVNPNFKGRILFNFMSFAIQTQIMAQNPVSPCTKCSIFFMSNRSRTRRCELQLICTFNFRQPFKEHQINIIKS